MQIESQKIKTEIRQAQQNQHKQEVKQIQANKLLKNQN